MENTELEGVPTTLTTFAFPKEMNTLTQLLINTNATWASVHYCAFSWPEQEDEETVWRRRDSATSLRTWPKEIPLRNSFGLVASGSGSGVNAGC